MAKIRPYAILPGWRLLLRDAGINPDRVLRRAGLQADLFAGDRALLESEEYFRLFRGIEEESDESAVALRLGAALSADVFDPPFFAAFCSPNLNTALDRVARYKPLIGPMVLDLAVGRTKTAMTIHWPASTEPVPTVLIETELVFFVQLARIGTRARIRPLEVESPHLPTPAAVFTRYFGVPVKQGKITRLVFSAEDAAAPFLTANEKMWKVFEPDLRRRLSDLDRTASAADRVRAALLEMLPGGAPNMADVAKKLGTSARTLQRRLHGEQASYQAVLHRTRCELASHYLNNTELPSAEIAYLLGYEDPNCFFRAFRGWTGINPSLARKTHKRGGAPTIFETNARASSR
ncbi:MAG TPA: AraC family transcriptional regulator ligand-binding domain-containing protein [Kofleriaceae bacterium]|jgi:AraC-like DNA-binding protein|nr:AraC family transcriptional regulator ligand-binding domain-containing protein [Kofleriaceae bacterium]